jgi:hypothetical protein
LDLRFGLKAHFILQLFFQNCTAAMANQRSQRQPNHPGSFKHGASKQEDRILARKDAQSALIVWLFLEGLSLFIVPESQLIPGEHKLSFWLSLSIPLGLVGAVLIGVSSWLLKYVQEQIDRQHPNKRAMLFSSQAIGWLGLIGVGFPSIMVGLTLLSYISNGV